MTTGLVARLVEARGFGFIKTSDGKQVFFHRNALLDCEFEQLRVGDGLEFDVEETAKGENALSVRKLT